MWSWRSRTRRGDGRPFVPESIVGGSLLVEGDAFDKAYWLRSYRGVELLDARDGAVSGGSTPAFRHVLVYGCMKWRDEASAEGFESVVAAASSRPEGTSLRIVERLGRAGRLRLLVLEPLEGIPLDRLVDALHKSGQRLSVSLALALVAELLPFVQSLRPRLEIFAGLRDLVLSPAGIVRTRPLPTWAYCEHYSNLTNDPILDTGMASCVLLYNPSVVSDDTRAAGPEHDERRRIHIVGMLLYELLIRDPFPSFPELMQALHAGRFPSLDALHLLSPPIATLVDRAFARRSEHALTSWDELLQSLAAAQAVFEPVERRELVALHDASPVELRLTLEPPRPKVLRGWRALPRLGYEPWLG